MINELDILKDKRKNKFSLNSFQRQNTKLFKFQRLGNVLYCKNKKNNKTFNISKDDYEKYYRVNHKNLVMLFVIETNIDLLQKLINVKIL